MTDLNPGLAKVTMPVWSPDGGRIAYIENDLLLRIRTIPGLPGVPGVPTVSILDQPGQPNPPGAPETPGPPGTTTGLPGERVVAGRTGASTGYGPAPDSLVVLDDEPSEFLTWSPDGTAVLLAGGGRPSQIVRLSGEGAGIPEPFLLVYDTNRRQGSPPQWSPLAPAPGPRPASTGGTARDA